ncbi:MAG: hypothetical protein C5B54_08220 [Acidobacteria bacterium]|nr:MAG: hypothetical protein C5B54_08220 [Acidobacteriota bacterium]
MRKTYSILVFCLILLFIGILSVRSIKADEQPIESYSASISSMGGSSRAPTPVNIRIFSYTSDEDRERLAEMLKTKGQDAVADAIFKVVKGKITPVGGVGMDINYIRALQTDKGKTIRLACARQMSFFEQNQAGLSTEYPFTIVDLTFGNDGKIEGTIVAKASVQLNKDNVVDIKSYGSDRLRLLNIKKQK